MKIAIVSPLNYATKPKTIGSVEYLVGNFIDYISKIKGIEITLFATGDSIKKCKLISINDFEFGCYCHSDIEKVTLKQIKMVNQLSLNFDIIHSHLPVLDSVKLLNPNSPVLKTLHGALIKMNDSQATKLRLDSAKKLDYLTPVSKSLYNECSKLNYTDIVYNGININDFKFSYNQNGDDNGDYWAFMGRINPEKGLHYAIDVANYHNKRLKIAGSISSTSEKKYFNSIIKPRLNNKIQYIGVLSDEKYDFLKNASLIISPSCNEEAFGLTNVEALASGTPVLATNRGAFPEIISNGVNGYLVPSHKHSLDIEALYEMALKAEKLDRKLCRESVINKFTIEKMSEGYLEIYKKIINGDI